MILTKSYHPMYMKNSYGPMPRAIGGMIEDLFQNGFSKIFNDEPKQTTPGSIPVNIQETEKGFDLQVVAPGLKKEDFKVSVDNSVLTISYEYKQETPEAEGTWLRNEYRIKSFKRSFTLNEKIDTASIAARYTEGILHLALPKKEQPETSAQEINVG